MPEETERERHLHAMYDAWQWLEREAHFSDEYHYAGAARAILRGQLQEAEYPPFLAHEAPNVAKR